MANFIRERVKKVKKALILSAFFTDLFLA